MTPVQTNPGTAQAAPRWPADVQDGARLILDTFHALMTGPAAAAYVKQGMAGITIDLDRAMDDSEALAAQAVTRSFNRAAKGPLGEFFKQAVKDAQS